MQLIRIGYNHDTGRKIENLTVVLKKISAQFQLENWSAPARLGTFTARARSSQKIPARTHLYSDFYIMNLNPTVVNLLGTTHKSSSFQTSWINRLKELPLAFSFLSLNSSLSSSIMASQMLICIKPSMGSQFLLCCSALCAGCTVLQLPTPIVFW